MSLTDFLLMWQPVTSPRSKSLSSPDLPMLLVLLSNEQHSFLPPFISVSAVVVTYRLQYTITKGCPDTFDQIVYSIPKDRDYTQDSLILSCLQFQAADTPVSFRRLSWAGDVDKKSMQNSVGEASCWKTFALIPRKKYH
jgi:hypothetical protein